MNISKNTIDLLNEKFFFNFCDDEMNEVSTENATQILIGFTKNGEYIGRSIKETKQ